MKRKVLAILVPAILMAGAANAAEIYNKNGNKVDLYGKVDARHTFSDNLAMMAMKPMCRLVSKAKPRSLTI
jgi:predicted porin